MEPFTNYSKFIFRIWGGGLWLTDLHPVERGNDRRVFKGGSRDPNFPLREFKTAHIDIPDAGLIDEKGKSCA